MPQAWTFFTHIFKPGDKQKEKSGAKEDKKPKSRKKYSKIVYDENSKFQKLRDSLKFKEEDSPLYQNVRLSNASQNRPHSSFDLFSPAIVKANQFIN